jgi:glucose/arabinose dehydrogenase
VDRFRFDGSKADLSTRSTVIMIEDFAPNHNGGGLLFGPDGYLYYSMGDGGGGGDPRGNGQKTTDLLGNILRIDPLHASGGKPYAIPSDNPFADGKGGAPEVYVYGLRNPWRFSFDRSTKDLWIADVGQNEWEEINRLPAGEIAGANLGWAAFEGTHKYGDATAPADAVPPVYEYNHSGGRCAVTGGYVYRGTKIPDLAGIYLFVDYCGGAMQGLRMGSDGKATALDLAISVPATASFVEDANGEIYALSTGGTIARIDGV